MGEIVEISQPMPDNVIRIYSEGDNKRLKIFASYRKSESHFSVYLTCSEANWLASEPEQPQDINWFQLEDKKFLRVIKNQDVRQIVLSGTQSGKEISLGLIGVMREDVIYRVISALRD